MRAARLGLTLAAALAAAGCGRREEPPLASGPAPGVQDRVRVLQGDVLIVDGKNLRLAGAYAPQPIPHALCWAEAAAALRARDQVRSMVSGARSVQVRLTGGHDEYSRPFADIGLDGADVGEALRLAGLAGRPPKPGARFDWCAPISQAREGAPPERALMDIGG
jgi:endonuclease YncB( thermonuclease family)